MSARREVVLVRHGQTEWSLSGRHTGRTDIPLTDAGRANGEAVGRRLAGREFACVLTSPLSRAIDTCRLAGLGEVAQRRDELLEWDYGDYEGVTTPDVRKERPGWLLWRDGCPSGEAPADVAARVDPLITELREGEGDCVLFAHGHILRALAARWLDMPVQLGANLLLSTAAVSILGWDREQPAISLWNDTSHVGV